MSNHAAALVYVVDEWMGMDGLKGGRGSRSPELAGGVLGVQCFFLSFSVSCSGGGRPLFIDLSFLHSLISYPSLLVSSGEISSPPRNLFCCLEDRSKGEVA